MIMPAVPSATWQMLELRNSGESLPRGLDATWDVGVGLISRLAPRYKRFLQRTEAILSLEKEFSYLPLMDYIKFERRKKKFIM